MTPRLHSADLPLAAGDARHAAGRRRRATCRCCACSRARRVTLFNGDGGEWAARDRAHGPQRRAGRASARTTRSIASCRWRVTLAVGMPANERMDALVEKATELGAARDPAAALRTLGAAAERASARDKRGRALAAVSRSPRASRAAARGCRGSAPVIDAARLAAADAERRRRTPLRAQPARRRSVSRRPWPADAALFLSGPEGGLTEAEEALRASRAGFAPVSLGPRVLRADTAPLAALAALDTPRPDDGFAAVQHCHAAGSRPESDRILATAGDRRWGCSIR